jgi:hypothetical protein
MVQQYSSATFRKQRALMLVSEGLEFKDGKIDIWGTGSPEGVVTAKPGSRYGDESVSPSILYYKHTGSGNTGWAEFSPVAPDRVIDVIAGALEVPGVRYATWAAADTYVQTQTPSTANRWAIKIYGQNAENIVLRAWIRIIGEESQTRLSGAITCDSAWTVDPYERVIQNCEITGTLSPAGTVIGVDLEQMSIVDCVIKGGTANAGVTGRIDTFYGSVQGGNWSNIVSLSILGSLVQAAPGLAIIFGSLGSVIFDNSVLLTGVPGTACTLNGGLFSNCNIGLNNAQFVFNTGSYTVLNSIIRASLSSGANIMRFENVSTFSAPTPNMVANDGGSIYAYNTSRINFTTDVDGGSGGGTLYSYAITGLVTNNGTWDNDGPTYDPNKLPSGLVSVNTQDAIDELADGMSNSIATINTTDNSVSILDTIATTTDSEVYIVSIVTGRRTGGTAGANGDAAAYERKARIKNIGGVVTIHDPEAEYTSEDQIGWQCYFDTSGSDIVLRVQGATNNNVTWKSSTKVMVNP